jgi:hypothetical protein
MASERPARQRCQHCGQTDSVMVTPFRWSGYNHLTWRCVACRQVWATPERRRLTGE